MYGMPGLPFAAHAAEQVLDVTTETPTSPATGTPVDDADDIPF
jgi:hypothetical protein